MPRCISPTPKQRTYRLLEQPLAAPHGLQALALAAAVLLQQLLQPLIHLLLPVPHSTQRARVCADSIHTRLDLQEHHQNVLSKQHAINRELQHRCSACSGSLPPLPSPPAFIDVADPVTSVVVVLLASKVL